MKISLNAVVIGFILCLSVLIGTTARAQKISQAESSASGSSSSDSQSGGTHPSHYDGDHYYSAYHHDRYYGHYPTCWPHHGWCSPTPLCRGCSIGETLSSGKTPIIIYHIPERGYFLRYPYAQGHCGSMIITPARRYYIPLIPPNSTPTDAKPPREAQPEESAPATVTVNPSPKPITPPSPSPSQTESNTPADDSSIQVRLEQVPDTSSAIYYVNSIVKPPEGTSPLAFNLAPEYSYDFDGVHRPSLYYQLDVARLRMGIEGGFSVLLEPLSGGEIDVLYLGDINVLGRIVQLQEMQFYLGVGARYMVGEDTYGGFNGTARVNIYPGEPVAIVLVADGGNIGQTTFAHLRGDFGLSFKGWEPYVGFDFMRISPVNFYGPLVGIRKWL